MKKIFNTTNKLNILSFSSIFLPLLIISGPLLTDILISILAISFFFFIKEKKYFHNFFFIFFLFFFFFF